MTSKGPAMSLESAADEERRMVLDQLEGKSGKGGSPMPKQNRNNSPAPIRSMLDVSTGLVPRHDSNAGIGVGITARASSQSSTVRSMLDIARPTSETSQQRSAQSPLSSSTLSEPPQQEPRRSPSDTPSKPSPVGLPKIDLDNQRDFTQNHQFDVMPSVMNKTASKRSAHVGKAASDRATPSALSAPVSGDLHSLPRLTKAREARHNSTIGVGTRSISPSSRLVHRSGSPGPSLLSSTAPTIPVNAYVTDSGKVVDLDKAYRKLSNVSGGSSSFLSGDPIGERVPIDPVDEGGDAEAAVESSDEDDDDTSEDEWKSESARGRRRNRRKKGSVGSDGDADENANGSRLGTGTSQPREAQSLLAAAEEERRYSLIPLRTSILIRVQARNCHQHTSLNHS